MGWACSTAGKMIKSCRIFFGNPVRKRPHGREKQVNLRYSVNSLLGLELDRSVRGSCPVTFGSGFCD